MKKILSLLPVCLAVSLGAIAVSCGSFSSNTTGTGGTGASGSGNTSMGGSSGDTSVGGSGNSVGSGGGAACASGLQCAGSCIDPMSDSANCGTCGHGCSGDQSCQAGTCACATGKTECAGSSACVDTQADPANCGACGTACSAGQVCSLGACAATCASGLTACSASCVDVTSNSANCGACGMACSAGQTCKSGMCVSPGMCDLLATAGHPCVAAHSTVRALFNGYSGPLYQVCKGSATPGPNSCSTGMTQDIGTVAGGYADADAQDKFCTGSTCTISKIYDQTSNANHLEPSPAGGPTGKPTPDNPADATALKTTVNGHAAYGVLIKRGIGYRKLVATGTATGDQPQGMYMVSSQKDLINGCCFDYGNAEIDAHDDGNGTMEAVYLGLGVVWGTGVSGGPWVMADLENGVYAGWENNQDRNISTNTPVTFDFVTGIVLGDTASQNGGKGRFAVYGGDATSGTVKTMYDGIRPAKTGYVPMQKQGSIILGTGGDNSSNGGGRWYEGVMTNSVWSMATVNAVQANIVAARYGQ